MTLSNMSGILEKTIESLGTLLSPLSSGPGISIKAMFERCMAARTKREEDWCIQDALKSISERLAEPSSTPSAVKKMLVFVVFAELLGYKAAFAHIHAVKLAQRGSVAEKKMGYMVCVQLLSGNNQLSMLLVNTIIRDLASRNLVNIAMALAATCHLIPSDQAPSILPMVADKLAHSNEYIRGKAVIVLHHFLRLCPNHSVHYIHRVRGLLGDSDPGVVALVLQYLLDLIKGHNDLTEGLCTSVVSIQEQIIQGKLPEAYSHHGISAPWMQLTILKLIRHLKPPLIDVQRVLYDTYTASGGENALKPCSNLRAAISIECLMTMLELGLATKKFLSLVMSTIGHLLLSPNVDFRYEGLALLQNLLNYEQIHLNHDQHAVIMRCLQHPDNAIKVKSLHLLYKIADSSTAESICDQMIDFMKNHCSNDHLQDELVSLAVSLAEKYPCNENHWHLASLLRLLPMSKDKAVSVQAVLKSAIIKVTVPGIDYATISSVYVKVFSYLKKHSESKVAPTSILELYVWMLSNFHVMLREDAEVSSVSLYKNKTHLFALEKIVSLGKKVFQNQIQNSVDIVPPRIHKLMYEIVGATRTIILSHYEFNSCLVQFLKDLISASMTRVFGDVALRCICREVLSITSACPELRAVPTEKNFKEKPDFTMSFLDDFVSKHLEEGGVPYKPMPAPPGTKASVLLALQMEQSQEDGELCGNTLIAAGCSLGSSVLSLAGTENVNNRAESVSSVSSEESKCWTFTSPIKEIELIPVWTKEGRVKGNDPTEDEIPFKTSIPKPMSELQEKIQPGPSVSSWLQKSIREDPFENLNKEFDGNKSGEPST